MKKIVYLLILFSAVIFLIPACSDSNKQVAKNVNIQGKEFQDKLIDANKMYASQLLAQLLQSTTVACQKLTEKIDGIGF